MHEQGNQRVRLTIRLLCPHHRLTPCRETLLAEASDLPCEISLVTNHRPLRTFFVLLVLALSAAATLVVASPAGAATACGKKVLADWYDNGRIDRLYPLNCYEEAIDAIPDDLKPYADAEDVITRALQAALRGELDEGGRDPTPNDDDPLDPDKNPGNGNGGDDDGSGGTGSGDNPEAAPDVDTSGPSSVPIPLLVLGGLSLALLAAGGLGYLSRRRAAAGDAGPHDDLTL